MEQKKYYQLVPVSEFPEKDIDIEGESIMVDLYAGGYGRGYYDFKVKCWRNEHGDKMNATHWLRPTDLSALIREERSKAWDAAENYTGQKVLSGKPNIYPDKETYLQSLQK